MLLSELLTDVLTRSGVSASDQALIEFIGKAELQIEVPEPLTANAHNLISIEAAKNHPALKSHYYGASLTPVEKEIEKLMDSLEFSDEQKAAILGTKSTYEKFPLIAEKLKETIEAKSKKSGTSATATDELNKLVARIAEMEKLHQSEVKTLNDNFTLERINERIASTLGGYNFTDALPREIAIKTAQNIISENLANKKAKIKLNNNSLELANGEDDTLPYFENNKPVSFKDFVDRSVADLLKKNNGNPAPNPAPNPNPNPQPSGGSDWLNNSINSDLEALRASRI